jgi:hypothetical protein
MAVTTVSGIEELLAKAGQHLGYSSWYEITQDKVKQFCPRHR